jgi:hypothetical protein
MLCIMMWQDDGFRLIGPFVDADEADRWIETPENNPDDDCAGR